MWFLSRTQLIAALGAVGLALFVLDLVRRRRLSEEYSLLWVLATTAIAVLGFCTPLLVWVTQALGILGAASTVFACGLAFALAMLLYLSTKMSRLGQQNHVLTQELALLRSELDRLEASPGKERA
jgi:hypothetical protein